MKLWRKAGRILLLTAVLTIPVCACERSCHNHGALCRGDCGYADFFVHTHEQICYYGNGNIRCSLPMVCAHTHSAQCYETVERLLYGVPVEQQVLTCSQPEIQLHIHEASCFRDGIRSCGQLEIVEHRHSAQCFVHESEDTPKAGNPFVCLGLLLAAAGGVCLYTDPKAQKMRLPQL